MVKYGRKEKEEDERREEKDMVKRKIGQVLTQPSHPHP
jgi:hypothetical protein